MQMEVSNLYIEELLEKSNDLLNDLLKIIEESNGDYIFKNADLSVLLAEFCELLGFINSLEVLRDIGDNKDKLRELAINSGVISNDK